MFGYVLCFCFVIFVKGCFVMLIRYICLKVVYEFYHCLKVFDLLLF